MYILIFFFCKKAGGNTMWLTQPNSACRAYTGQVKLRLKNPSGTHNCSRNEALKVTSQKDHLKRIIDSRMNEKKREYKKNTQRV